MSKRLIIVGARAAAIGLSPILAGGLAASASAQGQRIAVPAMPLAQALDQIRSRTGATIDVDPDAVKGLTSNAVRDAKDALAAVRQATRGLKVSVSRNADGAIVVANDILVVAHRDEAETSVLVRGDTSSSRTGESLRNQPRNVQVISAKLLEQQQAQSLPDALRNAGGVTVNAATVQGGVGYTVRGLSTGGAVNGLPTPASSTFAAGSTQPLVNIERLEVLKGPDAILLGGDSLGGTVNIVTKKPSADERLYVSSEIGSFGAVRGTVDANRALSDDGRFSARIIATAATADRNFGGYRGNEDYLFAPSLRYKNAGTDVILSLTTGTQYFGTVPYTLYDTTTQKPVARPVDQPLLGGRDQYSRIGSTIYDAQVKQVVASWLTLSGHYQHQDTSLLLRQYSPYVLLAPNTLLVSGLGTKQSNTSDTFDGYARATVKTGPIEHKLIVGGMTNTSDTQQFSAIGGSFAPYNYVTGTPPLRPIAQSYSLAVTSGSKQNSYYAQYLAKFWKIALMASVRKTDATVNSTIVGKATQVYKSNGDVTPSFGAVVFITDNLSVYGSLAYGFRPSFVTDRFLNLLPDNRTRNAETGFKLDLFDKRVLVNGSWFKLRETNRQVADPVNRLYYVALPGQFAQGVDFSISGEPLKGLLVSGNFTRTEYSILTPNPQIGTVVQLQPRDQYNVYASYRHRVAEGVTAGLGGGLFGRSSAPIDAFGRYWIGPARQVDLNSFLTVGKLDLNLGVRNLFDRRNYMPTIATTYVPLGETRTWRLTVGYRFR